MEHDCQATPISTVIIKRMDGTAAELSEFKKGKKYGNLGAAENQLWHWALTAPPRGEPGHRVAVEVILQDGRHGWGSVTVNAPESSDDRIADIAELMQEQLGAITDPA